jgi:RNA polymerase sigma factor (sigma-70 family)
VEDLTDATLVASAKAGEMGAYEALYRRHFDRAYDFAVRTTRDRERAADAVQEAFIKAHERLGQLRDPSAFVPWLFSIVRRETIAAVRSGHRESPTAPLESDDAGLNPLFSQIDEDLYDNPVAAAELADSARLVWDAAASLDRDTYTILDLHVRQGLSSSEIADVLGISKGSAYTRLNRMKERTAGAISTYLLIRKGSADCGDLAALVGQVELPPVTEVLRKRVERHVNDCETCTDRRKALVAPLKVFAALGLVPAPEGLREGMWERIREIRAGKPQTTSRRWPRYAVVAMFIAVFGLASGVAVGFIASLGSDSEAEASLDNEPGLSGSTTTTSQPDSTVTTASASTTSTDSVGSPTVPNPPTGTSTTPAGTSGSTPTDSTTTTQPDTAPPVIEQVDSTFNEIWEEDTQSLSCPPGTPNSTEVVAVVIDDGSGVAFVDASWNIDGTPQSATMTAAEGGHFFEFGPYPYLTVPDSTSPSIPITVRARDHAGNETKDAIAVVLHSVATCFG